MNSILSLLSASGGLSETAFDESRILLINYTNTYEIRPYLYNWNTGVLTALSIKSSFYEGGGAGELAVLCDPSGNYFIVGAGATNSGSFSNIGILLAGSTTFNYYFSFIYGGIWSDNKVGAPTWNPTAGKIQYIVEPALGASAGYSARLVQVSTAGVITEIGDSAIQCYNRTDMNMLYSQDSRGSVTFGTKMLGAGGNNFDADNNFMWQANSPYTSFSTIGSQVAGNASRNVIASIGLTKAVTMQFDAAYSYNNGTIAAISGLPYSNVKKVTGMCDEMWAIHTQSAGAHKLNIIKGIASFPWTIELSTDLGLSSTVVPRYIWGSGKNLYVISVNTATHTMYLAKVTVTDSTTGAYTFENRLMSGITTNSFGESGSGVYRVFPS